MVAKAKPLAFTHSLSSVLYDVLPPPGNDEGFVLSVEAGNHP
jgi:hypothetical protein